MRYPISKAALLLILALLPVRAASEDSGCDKFAWPLSRERDWFAASNKTTIASGDHLATVPAEAFVVRLQSARQISFAIPPEKKSNFENSFGASIWFAAFEKAGIYQVTLSDEASRWRSLFRTSAVAWRTPMRKARSGSLHGGTSIFWQNTLRSSGDGPTYF